ncbi:transposase [Terasakiispira papahanaumokuakeensis]|uniref:Transposase n=1 Tax=Terasakiispira papahanaumokuakeensis TaxID=197479 RepID=A0A1E2V8C0_9GAMM|nr:AAA family ATPase [Terasakiispira papahanaumokuakeensis]ODC03214.1 transposase [Terasakiispira papahanaumokuakeensis]
MLKLKAALAALNVKQTELARVLEISQASVAQLVNHDHWPKTLEIKALKTRISDFLKEKGATAATVSTLFEAEELPETVPQNSATKNAMSEEDALMLLRKQQLSPAAKQVFGLARDPFSEVRSADEVFLTPDSRYVREALRQTAKHGGFMAVVGESGAGKSTLRRDLSEWISQQNQQVVVIEPYVLGMEDNDIKGKTLKSAHIAEAIMASVAPGLNPKRSPEARFRQVHDALRESHRSGNRHLLVIEEAHGLPIPTLKHLKRFFELEDGFQKLLGIVLIGQSELAQKLDERNPSVREVVQRCEVVQLLPLDNELEQYLQHRFNLAGKALNDLIDPSGIEALRTKLTGGGSYSVLYPLAIHNVLTAAMNEAAELGVPMLSDELILGV